MHKYPGATVVTLSIGIDLAQARDRTAIAAVSSFYVGASEENDVTSRRRARRLRHHQLVRLDKLRPGLSYPVQAEEIVAIAEALAVDNERPTLFVDATGVGRAVVDLLRAASPFPVKAVTFTAASETVAHAKNNVSVPKTELVATLEVALSTRRLHASSDLPLREDLDRELRAFGYELSASGRPSFEGKGEHDDLVIALALGIWGGERGSANFAAFRDYMQSKAEQHRDVIEPK